MVEQIKIYYTLPIESFIRTIFPRQENILNDNLIQLSIYVKKLDIIAHQELGFPLFVWCRFVLVEIDEIQQTMSL